MHFPAVCSIALILRVSIEQVLKGIQWTSHDLQTKVKKTNVCVCFFSIRDVFLFSPESKHWWEKQSSQIDHVDKQRGETEVEVVVCNIHIDKHRQLTRTRLVWFFTTCHQERCARKRKKKRNSSGFSFLHVISFSFDQRFHCLNDQIHCRLCRRSLHRLSDDERCSSSPLHHHFDRFHHSISKRRQGDRSHNVMFILLFDHCLRLSLPRDYSSFRVVLRAMPNLLWNDSRLRHYHSRPLSTRTETSDVSND